MHPFGAFDSSNYSKNSLARLLISAGKIGHPSETAWIMMLCPGSWIGLSRTALTVMLCPGSWFDLGSVASVPPLIALYFT